MTEPTPDHAPDDDAPEATGVVPGAPAPTDATPGEPTREVLAEDVPVAGATRVRRAPRYPAFIVGGALLLGVVGLIGTLVVPGSGDNEGAAAVLTALTGAFLGAVLGAVLVAVLDRR